LLLARLNRKSPREIAPAFVSHAVRKGQRLEKAQNGRRNACKSLACRAIPLHRNARDISDLRKWRIGRTLFAPYRPFLKALKSLEMNEDILGFPNIRALRLRLAVAPSAEISGLRKKELSR